MINNLNFNRLRYGRIVTGLCVSLSLVFLTSMVTTTNQPITPNDENISNSITVLQSGAIVRDINQPDPEATQLYKTDPDTIRKVQQTRNTKNDQPDSGPQYPGGDKARIEYIVANTPYPEEDRKAGIKGTVYVQFVIESSGKVTNAKILKGVSPLIDKVALNAITNMPDWIPARKGNKPVSYEMTMPIKFELSDDKVGKVAKDPHAGDIFSKENSIPQKKEGSGVYTVVEVAPQFPGGDDARIEFLSKNITYPEQAKKEGIQGTVYITFVVQPDGSITDAKVLRGIGGGLDEIAIAAVQKMPKWEPGKVKGEPVPVQFNMPIKFKLTKDEVKPAEGSDK